MSTRLINKVLSAIRMIDEYGLDTMIDAINESKVALSVKYLTTNSDVVSRFRVTTANPASPNFDWLNTARLVSFPIRRAISKRRSLALVPVVNIMT